MTKLAVITVHGVRWRTKLDWQTRFGVFLKEMDPEIKVIHFRFGRMLGVVSWWLCASQFLKIPSWLRRYYVRKLSHFVHDLQKRFPDHEFSVAAHSFGGWLVEQALGDNQRIHLKNLVMIHCPVSAYIEKTSFWNWLEMGRIHKVFAWSSHKDKVIKAIALKPFGQNGYSGFIRFSNREDLKKPLYQPYPIPLFNIRTEENHFGVIDQLEKYGKIVHEQLIK